MNLKDKIEADLVEAMKASRTEEVSLLRLLKSSIKNAEIEKGATLDEADIIKTLEKQAKQRRDSIAQYEAGDRADLAKKEKAELDLIERYLPERISEEEVAKVVAEIISELKITSVQDMGKAIKAVMDKIGSQADGKTISDLVRKQLG